jgi:hypothetical protein
VSRNNIENQKKNTLNPLAGKRTLTKYFTTKNISSEDEELFFGHGIVLHKLRTTFCGRFYNLFALVKLFSFEPAYVSLQGIPSMQIALIFVLQTLYFAWIVHCGLVQKVFILKASLISDLLTEASLLIFIMVGLIFQSKGGADKMQPSISDGLQFTGMAFIGIACIANLAEFVSMLIRKIREIKNDRKVNEYIKKSKKLRDERDDSKKRTSPADNSRLLDNDDKSPPAVRDESSPVSGQIVPFKRRFRSVARARKVHTPVIL